MGIDERLLSTENDVFTCTCAMFLFEVGGVLAPLISAPDLAIPY